MGDRGVPRAEDRLASDRPLRPLELLAVADEPSDSTRDACGACDSIRETTAPGGCIHETEHWFVDHCIGPLGVRTLIVKPKRHVVHVADLSSAESTEMGVVLRQAAEVVMSLESPDQVYVTLWSHMHAVPGHIHFVVQPVTRARMEEHDGKRGCRLQVEMFDRGISPDPNEASVFAGRARDAWPRPAS